MTRKIPADAFERYAAMGTERSYEALAQQFGCSRRAITKRAAAEQWQERLRAIDQRARESTDAKILESREAMNERHLKVVRFMQSKGIELLRTMPIQSTADAIRAISVGLEQERLIRGEPTERVESIEAMIRRETATLLEVVEDDDEEDPAGQQSEAV